MILRRAALGSLAIAALLAACAAPPPPPPPAELRLTIVAGADQNPGPAREPSPVAVRIYDLAASGRFEQADVFALVEREGATLGDQALGSEEVIVRPGETRQVVRQLKPGVRMAGIVVLFRNIDRARWRVLAPVAPHGPTALTLKISGDTASLAPS